MRPDVSDLTDRAYAGLPEVYRTVDPAQPAGGAGQTYPLLRYLALALDPLSSVEDVQAAIDYVAPRDGGAPGDTSALVDPATADESWLPWLAQLLGVPVVGLTVDESRAALTNAAASWAHGTRSAIAARAAENTTGTHHVEITYPYDPARPWVIGVGVHAGEVSLASTWDALEALGGADPATGKLATWEQLEAAASTPSGITWAALENAGSPVVSAEPERPAGYALELYFV